ncbi:MAG: RagB/SusD family nutrient uptake outer membrane protein, partial [Paramuribaculum sp.]|nr:RagB/SusD family nutrient uptake outer membrane protein [Paramuribaculum sp.]
EGHRLWDLRRWNISTGLAAYDYPNIKWGIKNVQLGNFVFPIPDDEINAGFGVEQTPGWADVRPTR